MSYHLSLNGTSDYLKTPSLTFTEVVIDYAPSQKSTTSYYFDARDATNTSPYILRNNGTDSWAGCSVYVNDVAQTNGTLCIPSGRHTLRIVAAGGSQTRTALVFFSRYTITQFMPTDIYRITIKNGSTVVADYDMTTGTVNDQSGNGNNATLVGGTWVQESSSGTTYTGSGAAQGTSSCTAQEAFVANASVTAQGLSTLSSIESMILKAIGSSQGLSTMGINELQSYAEIGSVQGQSSISAKELVLYLGSGSANGISTVTANETMLAHSGTVYSGSGSAQGMSQVSANERIVYNDSGSAQGTSTISVHEIISLMASGLVEGYSTVSVVDSSMQIIGRIELKGQRDLYVYLKGSGELNVNLKGGV